MTRTEIYYDTLEEVVPSNLGVSLIFKGGSRHQMSNPAAATLTVGQFIGIDSHGSIWVKKEA